MTLSSRQRWLIVWVLAILPLLGWWLYGLLDVDEGFYGAVTAEMNRRGEWITPFYNGQPWFEKPILLYWLAKPCLALFGNMIGPRLPSVLCGIGTYGVIAWFSAKRFEAKTAQLAVLMCASSLLMVGVGRMMMTDMPLVLCLTAAMTTFWESLVGNPKWRIATAGLLGLGVLAKGPVALILFAIIAGWTYWREPNLRKSFRGRWIEGTVLLFLVVATWYLPAYRANGQLFVQKFLIEQNVGRFTGGDAAHTIGGIGGFVSGLVMYFLVLVLGMAPWSFFIWEAWPRDREEVPHVKAGLRRYLATWAGVVFVFFAISGAKLPHYILPMVPPLAMLIAPSVLERAKDTKRWFAGAAVSCVVYCLLANGVFLFWYHASGQAEVHAIARYVKSQGGDVAIYQMGRRNKDLGTGRAKLQETSLPSLLMYLDADALDTDDLLLVLKHQGPIWIITRDNRIQPADFIAAQRAGRRLAEVKPPVVEYGFRLYRLL